MGLRQALGYTQGGGDARRRLLGEGHPRLRYPVNAELLNNPRLALMYPTVRVLHHGAFLDRSRGLCFVLFLYTMFMLSTSLFLIRIDLTVIK